MFLKKYIVGFVLLLGLMTIGSIGVLAVSGTEIQSMEKENTLEVELKDDFFNPDTITIPKEKTTTLILKNNGNKKHTFTVGKLGIDEEIQPGGEKTITVKPDQPGTYELICRFHVQEGMLGKVIVQ
ncbi:cupredoxin domain-containing protein [Oceanobacillus senegalensis]|uniref:cupredoxin domain-containing protein n=1 Tax=Oceanobacillus senegalensis TaxID=1936063 RepID=UPI000A305EA9|nr:cupredoxin domain-containing protein [Oceanobacillus senegalensis]